MKSTKEKLHDWIYTLLYPAMLGTMIVSFLLGLTNSLIDNNYDVLMALFLILYFSSQHVENLSDSGNYQYSEFWADLVEFLLMAPLFFLLGYYENIKVLETLFSDKQLSFHLLLAFVLVLPPVARCLSGKFKLGKSSKGAWLAVLSICAALVAISGLIFQRNIWVIILLFFVLAIYLVVFVTGLHRKLGINQD